MDDAPIDWSRLIKDNDAAGVRAALAAGRPPNEAMDAVGHTPLMCAASNDRPILLALLLEAGADPNVCDRNGVTALLWALWAAADDAAQMLLDAGAAVGAARSDGETVLMAAAQNGSELLPSLLERGAEPRALVCWGHTALMRAAAYGRAPAVAALMSAAPDLINAVSTAVPTHPSTGGQTALMLAAQNAHVSVCRSLLEAGADPNTGDDRGHTALWYAAAFASHTDHEEACRLLVQEFGASVDAPAGCGTTALMHAVQYGDLRMVECLLALGARPLRRGPQGRTALDVSRTPRITQRLRAAADRLALEDSRLGAIAPAPRGRRRL